MSRLLLHTLVTTIAIPLCLFCLATGEAFAQQLAPPPQGVKAKLEALPPHVPVMLWGHDSAWLEQLRETEAAAAAPEQSAAAAAEAEELVIHVESAPGSAQQYFSFRDVTDRSEPLPEVLPMAERSRAVQEFRRSLMGKREPTGGVQQ